MDVLVTTECIGCGLCVEVCPQVFQLNEQNASQVVADANLYPDQVQDAASVCPVNAIQLQE